MPRFESPSAGGSLTLIERKTGAAASYSFSNIPQTYKHLLLVVQARSDGVNPAVSLYVRFNGDTGTNYARTSMSNANNVVSGASDNAATAMDIGVLTGAGAADATALGSSSAYIAGYLRSDIWKTIVSQSTCPTGGGGGPYIGTYGGSWESNSAITSMSVYPSSGSFTALTTADLYGVS